MHNADIARASDDSQALVEPSRKQVGRGLNVALWAVCAVLALLFFVAGAAKFVGTMNEAFVAWGYTAEFAAMIGILEILGAIGLLVRRAAGWAALGLMVLMLGAIWTLATHGKHVEMITPIVVFVALAFVSWGRGLPLKTREPGQDTVVPNR